MASKIGSIRTQNSYDYIKKAYIPHKTTTGEEIVHDFMTNPYEVRSVHDPNPSADLIEWFDKRAKTGYQPFMSEIMLAYESKPFGPFGLHIAPTKSQSIEAREVGYLTVFQSSVSGEKIGIYSESVMRMAIRRLPLKDIKDLLGLCLYGGTFVRTLIYKYREDL